VSSDIASVSTGFPTHYITHNDPEELKTSISRNSIEIANVTGISTGLTVRLELVTYADVTPQK